MPITREEVADKIRQLEKTDPARADAKVVDIIVQFYNVVEELQIQVAAGTTTIAEPLPDILK